MTTVATTERTPSSHRADVVKVVLEPHPDANTLSIVRVHTGYAVVVKTADWKDQTLGVYIPPDSVVDGENGVFSFLGKGKHRIKVKTLRGVKSMGLLVPVPEGKGLDLGDDVAPLMGITHYNPPEELAQSGDCVTAPDGYYPKYDLESLRRHADCFKEGEMVWITEKIHGANARFVFVPGEGLFAGSRNQWKKNAPNDMYWKALRTTRGLAEFLTRYPLTTVYGEVYGTQDLKYGVEPGQVKLAVFDILMGGQWLNPDYAHELGRGLPWVPFVGLRRFKLDEILAAAEGPSLISGAEHIREGIVVKPIEERTDPFCGRVCLKAISNSYMERP